MTEDQLQTAFVTSGTVEINFAKNKVTYKQGKGQTVGQSTVEELYNAFQIWRRKPAAHLYIEENK